MIEFKGELSGNAKKFILKNQVQIQSKSSIATSIIFSVPVIALAYYVHIAVLLFFIPLALLILFSILPPGKSSQKIFVPQRIFIDKTEGTIVHQCEKIERFHMISSVESVIDYGDWYYFIFGVGDRDPYFVCQKDLLTKGTLSEFEELFEGKIERRTTT